MKNMLMIYFSVVILSILVHGFTIHAYGETGCEKSNWDSPLDYDIGTDDITSEFNPAKDHYGTDYRAADGDNVRAVANGKIWKIEYQPARKLSAPNARGLMQRGAGRYVVIEHKGGIHLTQVTTTCWGRLSLNRILPVRPPSPCTARELEV